MNLFLKSKRVFLLAKSLVQIKTQVCFQSGCKYYQIKTPLFKKILSNELVYLSELFKKHEYELRIAGGAVRDLLMDIEPNDIDLATNALPNQMLSLFEKEKIRIFNLNGLKHGTIAIRINDKSNFEITTLRIDVKTYGRHAEVEFTSDWHKDAIRRDLTVNSLFIDFDGKVYDYVNGVDDLRNRIIRFVGIPDKRIKEDYLRIMRYFRFYSRVCLTPDKHDELSLKAIRENVDGLKLISGERIGYELRKILSQKFSDSFMKMFYDLNIYKYLGFPENGDLDNYNLVYKNSFEHKPEPMTLLNALIKNENDLKLMNDRIKLSNDEKYLLNALREHVDKIKKIESNENILKYFEKEFIQPKSNTDRPLKKSEAIEILKYTNKSDLINDLKCMVIPVFPLSYKDIINHQVCISPTKETKSLENLILSRKLKYNYMLKDLKKKWIDSDCKLTKQNLLDFINDEYIENYVKKTKQSK